MTIDKDMQVLVVDNYAPMRHIIRNLLNKIGFNNIDEAQNGQIAFTMFSAKKYGMVISDWNMEPISGLELLKRIRAEKEGKTLPFIIVSAESKGDSVITAKQAGVDSYIVKPFNADTLRTKIVGAFKDTF